MLALTLAPLGGILVAPLFVAVTIQVSAIALYVSSSILGSVHDASGFIFGIAQTNTELAFCLELRCLFGVIVFMTFL